jgi:hypothetical protein
MQTSGVPEKNEMWYSRLGELAHAWIFPKYLIIFDLKTPGKLYVYVS